MKSSVWIKRLLTEIDNETPDLIRILALLSILTGLGLSVYDVYIGNPFNFQQFGFGIGTTFGGVAVALGFKKETPIQENTNA